MSGLDSAAASLLEGLLRTAWQVAVLVPLVLVIQLAFGRFLSPRWRYALWLVVVVRLLLPALPEVSLGVVRWELPSIRHEASEVASADVPPLVAPMLPGSTSRLRPPESRERKEPVGSGSPRSTRAAQRLAPDTRDRSGAVAAAPPIVRLSADLAPSPTHAPEPAPRARRIPWLLLAAAGYLLVAAALAFNSLRRELVFRRALAREPRLEDPRVLALLEACRAEMGLRREVTAVRTRLLATPAVTGLRHPQVLIPESVLARFDESELRHVFLHELAHLKRGDVALNALLAVLGCVYWFHPLVRVAFTRLRASQEALRDFEALSTVSAPAPLPYAHTLLRLLEEGQPARANAPGVGFLHGGHDIQKRVLMIANFDPRAPRFGALGAALVLGLSWVALTSAAPAALKAELAPDPDPAPEAAEVQSISVERHLDDPPWKKAMLARLETRRDLVLEDVELEAAVAELRALLDLNVVVEPSVLDALRGTELSLRASKTTLREILDLFCRVTERELAWGLVNEAIYIAELGENLGNLELRFYNIEELTDGEEEAGDDIAGLIWEFSTSDWRNWDVNGVSLTVWNDRLVINQTPEIHHRVEAFLNFLLAEGRRPVVDPPSWRSAVDEALGKRLDVALESVPMREALDQLGQAVGLTIIADEDYELELVSLVLNDATLASVLAWIADPLHLNTVVENGAIYLRELRPVEVELYDLGELLDIAYDEQELRDMLETMILDFVDPWSWDQNPSASMTQWNRFLLIAQYPENHVRIRALVDAVGRSLGV